MNAQDKMEKLIDWALNNRAKGRTSINVSEAGAFNYWMGYIEGIIDAAAIHGIIIPRSRLFLTSEGVEAVLAVEEKAS